MDTNLYYSVVALSDSDCHWFIENGVICCKVTSPSGESHIEELLNGQWETRQETSCEHEA